jgi:hypothetical protein
MSTVAERRSLSSSLEARPRSEKELWGHAGGSKARAGSLQAAARAARGRRRAAGAGGVQLGSCVGEKMGKK